MNVKGKDPLTGFGKIRCFDEIPDQSHIRYCRYYRGAYGHPEGFTSGETVIATMLHTEGENSNDVQYVWENIDININQKH